MKKNGTMEKPVVTPKMHQQPPNAKMSPLQAYILEQAKLSGYSVADIDRDSYVESDIDDRGLVSDR